MTEQKQPETSISNHGEQDATKSKHNQPEAVNEMKQIKSRNQPGSTQINSTNISYEPEATRSSQAQPKAARGSKHSFILFV